MSVVNLADKVRASLTDEVVRRALRATFLRKNDRESTVALVYISLMCFAVESTFDENPFVMAGASMKREVWLELQNRLGLSDTELRALHERVASWGEKTDVSS